MNTELTRAHGAKRFSGQVAVITGAAQGIGFATARYLAREGASVAIVDVNTQNAERAAASINADGGTAGAFTADVTDGDAVRTTVSAIHGRFGRIEVLINNAGMYPHIPFAKVTEQDWQRVLDVNLKSTYLVTQAVLPIMVAAAYGRIVNTASGVVFNGISNVSAYAASKAGVIGLTRVLSNEYGPLGITCNAVSPGLVETEGVLADIEGIFEATIATQSVKRRGNTADIAACVAYLASPEAGFINGQTLNIDGGARFI